MSSTSSKRQGIDNGEATELTGQEKRALIAVLLGVRLWNKAGADIRAANAQERIAEAAERCQPAAPSPCSTWRPAGGF